MQRGIAGIAAVLLAVGMARAAEPVAAEKGALVRVITRWDAGCDASNRSDWDDMVRAWYNDITDDDAPGDGHGDKAYLHDGFYQNGNIVDSDFTDLVLVPWGLDHLDDHVDEPDVAMIALHGGEDPDDLRWRGKVRVDEPGAGNCRAYQGEMSFGETDLEFLHLSSCHSMDQDDWVQARWGTSFAGLHQVNGFHGIMWISDWYSDRYEEFSDDAFDDPISEEWVESHYDGAFWPGEFDHCPVSRGVGSTRNDVWNRMDHEEYDNVFSDPANDWWGVVYIEGCDPKDDPALPN